jgi:polyhydroxyalkanoate synthesis regulator phasin
MIERELKKGKGGDELGWATLAQRQAEFAQGSRAAPKYYGNVYYADRTPDDGVDNPEPYQMGTDGQISWIGDQPGWNGAKSLPPVKNVNTGTEFIVQGPGGTQIAPAIAIDNAGKAAETAVGEGAGKAAIGLPDFELSAQNATDLIDSISASPDLEGVTGMVQGRMAGMTQGGTDTIANVDELVNKVFPMAIQALVGLGAMSNMEGQAMSQSLANLDRKKGTPAFQQELQQLKALLQDKLVVARKKAAMAGGAAPIGDAPEGIDPEDWKYMPEELKAQWVR